MGESFQQQLAHSHFFLFFPLISFLLQGHLAAAAFWLAPSCIDWKGVGWRRARWKHCRWYNWNLSEPATSELLLDWGRSTSPSLWCLTISCFCKARNGTWAWNCYFCAQFPFCCAICQTPRVADMHLPFICGLVPLNACLTSFLFSDFLRVLTASLLSLYTDVFLVILLGPSVSAIHEASKAASSSPEKICQRLRSYFLFARPSSLCEMPCCLQLCINSP